MYINFSLPIVLVGNKTDLHMERTISYEEGRRLADDWKAIFLETSAKQNAVSYSRQFSNRLVMFFFFSLFLISSMFYLMKLKKLTEI